MKDTVKIVMGKNFKRSIFFLVGMMLVVSCAPKKLGSKSNFTLSDIFSTREQSASPFIGILKLKSQALLSGAEFKEGKVIIDENLKKLILAEQASVIESLKNLSPDIQILASYKLVLNGLAVVVPAEFTADVAKIEGVSKIVENSKFGRPIAFKAENVQSIIDGEGIKQKLNEHNSLTFIGADKLHAAGIKGEGMRVGIIDTGIDYTHSMLGGPGTKGLYKSIDPSKATSYFPNAKVIGGRDFTGTDYEPGAPEVSKNIPVADENPLDEAGHGTHVSGTIAGIGDGINTYSGVAPEAKLFALKVFGADGGTSDMVVIQALEFAADPTEKNDPNNHLDVVNLSLGGNYGKEKTFYSEAIKNLTKAGTVVVASAGNSGDSSYVVGAPSTSDEAISVAASVDDMPQNIMIAASKITIGTEEKIIERIEGTVSVSAANSPVAGPFVYIGNGVDPIAPEVKDLVKGKIALMDRGISTFVTKIQIATDLGAIGVVMVNNADGDPIEMGGDEKDKEKKKFEIPAVMITKELGTKVKEALKNNIPVEFIFSPGKTIVREDLVDTITSFSSRGPRFLDSLIKPEITGPGAKIISAAMGKGSEGVEMSGTSMSGPHIAGVMALLKQGFPTLPVDQLKAKLLNSAKILKGKDGKYVPVSLQGAGRVQVVQAFTSLVVALPATLSLGEISVSANKSVFKTVSLYNYSEKDVVFSSKGLNGKNSKVSLPGSFKVKAKSVYQLNISFLLKRASADENNIESDGFVILTSGDGSQVITIPFLSVLNKLSNITGSSFVTQTDSEDDKVGAEVKLTLENHGQSSGDALIFNLLGTDERKEIPAALALTKSTSCDLEAAGIRIVETEVNKEKKKMLQIGIKLYDTLTMWEPCDVSLQIDSNGDGVADQELVGTNSGHIPGLGGSNLDASLLLDASKAREIRKEYEDAPKRDEKDPKVLISEKYRPALLGFSGMLFYNHSNVVVIEVDASKILTDKKGNIGIKLAVSNLEQEGADSDDYLGNQGEKWQKLNISENAFSFYDMPEIVTVKDNDKEFVSLKRGAGNAKLLILYPDNAKAVNGVTKDHQSELLVEELLN